MHRSGREYVRAAFDAVELSNVFDAKTQRCKDAKRIPLRSLRLGGFALEKVVLRSEHLASSGRSFHCWEEEYYDRNS